MGEGFWPTISGRKKFSCPNEGVEAVKIIIALMKRRRDFIPQ